MALGFKKKRKGLSPAVAVMLLTLVAVALVGGIWMYTSKFTKGEDVVQVQAYAIQNKYLNGKQVATVSLRLVSKSDKLLTINKITAYVTLSDGSTQTIDITYQNNKWRYQGNPIKVDGTGNNKLEASKTTSIALVFTNSNMNKPIVSLSFQVTLTDTAGHTYTFNSNEVSLE